MAMPLYSNSKKKVAGAPPFNPKNDKMSSGAPPLDMPPPQSPETETTSSTSRPDLVRPLPGRPAAVPSGEGYASGAAKQQLLQRSRNKMAGYRDQKRLAEERRRKLAEELANANRPKPTGGPRLPPPVVKPQGGSGPIYGGGPVDPSGAGGRGTIGPGGRPAMPKPPGQGSVLDRPVGNTGPFDPTQPRPAMPLPPGVGPGVVPGASYVPQGGPPQAPPQPGAPGGVSYNPNPQPAPQVPYNYGADDREKGGEDGLGMDTRLMPPKAPQGNGGPYGGYVPQRGPQGGWNPGGGGPGPRPMPPQVGVLGGPGGMGELPQGDEQLPPWMRRGRMGSQYYGAFGGRGGQP